LEAALRQKATKESHEPVELVKLLTRRISSKFGRAAGYAFAAALVAIPVVWSSIGPAYELLGKAWTNWRLNHPSTPTIPPGHFVVGIFIKGADKPDDGMLSDLQMRFRQHPAIEIIKIILPDGILDQPALFEHEIQNWIDETGAAGAIWGSINSDVSGNIALLNWSRPRFNDFVGWDANEWMYEPTIAFGALPRGQVSSFSSVWLKSQAKLFFYSRRLSRVQQRALEITKAERDSFRQIIADVCDESHKSDGTSCFLFARAQIELFLLDINNERLWCPKSENCVGDDYFSRWAGFDPFDILPPEIESPETFRNIFLALDYSSRKATTSRISNLASHQAFYRLSLFFNLLDPRTIDFSVETRYPRYEAMLAATKASFKFKALTFRLSYPVDAEPEFEKILSKPTFDDLKRELTTFQRAIDAATVANQSNNYELGLWRNRLGSHLIELAGMGGTPRSSIPELHAAAAVQFRLSADLLGAYQVRSPQRSAAAYLSFSRTRIRIAKDRPLGDAIAASLTARSIAKRYDLPRAYLVAQQTLAIAEGWSAVRAQSSEGTCGAVREWYVGARIARGTERDFGLGPDGSRSMLDELLLAFQKLDRTGFTTCLKALDLDLPRIEEDLIRIESAK
jgi:hypothetical protein